MLIERYAVGPLATNCYHLICERTGESVLVDPGGFPRTLFDGGQKPQITAILLTHGHFDHIGGAAEVAARTGAPILIHPLDDPMLTDPYLNGSGLWGTPLPQLTADRLISDGETIMFGRCALKVLHTPGHTRGGVTFLDEAGMNAFVGDLLFRLSVGRWDLDGGDYPTLMNTLRTLMLPLPDDTTVYPGHGDDTTIGFERRNNEFMMEA